jgi:cytochrome c peroxidase
LQVVPQFTEHYFDEDDSGDDSIDNGPTGGLTWDGRVDRGRDQARIPLFSSYEMANRNKQSVVTAAQEGSYSPELRKLSGGSADASAVLDTILEALEAWEGGIIKSSIRTAVNMMHGWLARPN